MTLHVVRAGARTLVQDQGRPGLGSIGVTASGAFDRGALRQALALVGGSGAGLETFGGLALRADDDHVVAVTGGIGLITVDGRPAAHGRALHLRAGSTLAIGSVTEGLRAYVAVAGDIAVDPVLGSRSTDTLAGLGPAPLVDGDVLPVGAGVAGSSVDDVVPLHRSGEVTVTVVLGPRDDWFTPAALRTLLEQPWTVRSDSDRIGVRLEGPLLERSRADELPSEPCVRGSIQVTAEGQPIVFGPDYPVTGGYPVIAVVADASSDLLAQVRPGQTVRFTRALSSR